MSGTFTIPYCFTWNSKRKRCLGKKSPVFVSTNAESTSDVSKSSDVSEEEVKYIYDRDKDDTFEVFVVCDVLAKVYHLGSGEKTTVRELKDHIKRIQKIPASLLLLFFKGVILDNSEILKDRGVEHRNKLELKLKLHTATCDKCAYVPMNFRHGVNVTLVTVTGRAFKAHVFVNNTVDSLKRLVEESFSVCRNEILLLFNGTCLKDDVTFEEYGITSDKNLLLIFYQYEHCGFCGGCAKRALRPTITLHYFRNVFVCLLQPQQTVKEFKEITYRYLNHIHPDLQNLMHDDAQLEDSKTMSDYGINDGDHLFIKLKFDSRMCDICQEPLS